MASGAHRNRGHNAHASGYHWVPHRLHTRTEPLFFKLRFYGSRRWVYLCRASRARLHPRSILLPMGHQAQPQHHSHEGPYRRSGGEPCPSYLDWACDTTKSPDESLSEIPFHKGRGKASLCFIIALTPKGKSKPDNGTRGPRAIAHLIPPSASRLYQLRA